MFSTEQFVTESDRDPACEVLGKTLDMTRAKRRSGTHAETRMHPASATDVSEIDVGMSFGVVGADPEVLEIDGDEIRCSTPGSTRDEPRASFESGE